MVAEWVGVGHQAAGLAGGGGALSQLDGLGWRGAVVVAEVGAWGSRAGVGAGVGVVAVEGSQGAGAVARLGPAREGAATAPAPWGHHHGLGAVSTGDGGRGHLVI